MNIQSKLGCAVIFAGFVSGADAGLSDFYIADGQGGIYSVDGSSLEATSVFSIDGGLAINDIIFVGNNRMLANVTNKLIQYDMTTGVETVIFDTQALGEKNDVFFVAGFAGTANNDLFFSVRSFTQTGSAFFGATYNPITQVYTELAPIEQAVGGLYFDHLEVGDNLFLGADFENNEIHLLNSLTGDIVDIYNTPFGAVSFLELDGQIFSLTGSGDMYSFDLSTGESEFFSHISGVSGNILGAASNEVFEIPAPGTLSLFGLVVVVGTRRRR